MRKLTDEEKDKLVNILIIGSATLVVGYLIGRFTAISDLKSGYLNAFIPKS